MLTLVNLSSLDLNLLLVLHTVLSERSVVASARKLSLTPSAISNALARARQLLGDPLLVRRGRGLAPTPRALALAPALAASFATLEGALNERTFDPRTTTREFGICVADGDQVARFPKLAAAFVRSLPCARLKAVSIDALISSGGLASPVADVAIAPFLDDPELHATPLYEEDAVLMVSRDHPRIRGRISAERFVAERHVDTHLALGKPGVGHRAAEAEFARKGLKREIAVTVPSFAAAAMVAAQTELIAAMPRRVAETFAAIAPVRIVESPAASLHFTMQLVWHARTHADPGARVLRELVVATFAGGRRPKARTAK